ncbi:hypothetical protein F4775DRAFT_331279 [Biscogniauxia sp. FL1348]|nr:hypothetical protein F4775DRAFT_331279 [Biscogniauxia sp. FL1348]
MEPLRLKPRKPVEDEVEDWDDDDFMIDTDEDLTFRNNSSNNLQLHRRDSHSSFRSDRESLSANEERHVHLPGDDEKSTLDAIAAATHVGIPIPTNVPPSALMGGTIKRLGGRKIKKIFQEDWSDDLELPAAGQALSLKTQDGTRFPEVLRQVSGSLNPTPAKKSIPSVPNSPPLIPTQPKTLGPPINLERFRDTEEDEDLLGDGSATIKAPKLRPRGRPMSLIAPPTPSPSSPAKKADDSDFELDLELPSDGKLQLSSRRDIPKTPSLHMNEDFEWGEGGSLGTRFGGTRRDAFSTRSSSVSALSPSLASSFTVESEDDTFEGLVLPSGPLDFSELLNRQKQSRSTERNESDRRPQVKQIGPPRSRDSGSRDSERRSRPRQSQSPRARYQRIWPRPTQSQSPVGRLPEKQSRPTRSPERRGIARLPHFMQSRSPERRDQQTQELSTQSRSPVGQDRDIQLRSPQSRSPGAVRRSLGDGDLGSRPYPVLSRSPVERVLENQARLAQSRSPVRRDAESRPRSAPTQSPGGRSLLRQIPSPSRSPPHSPIHASPRVSPRSPPSPPPRATPTASPRATPPTAKKTTQLAQDEDDLFSGLDFGDGNVFRPGKATLHRNIKVREARPSSPVRPKTAVSITFTNKPVTSTPSRLPRPTVNHERSHTQSSLEPVSESGGPIPQKPPRRPQSRLGHSAQSSLSSIKPSPTFSVPSSIPTTPRRRELGSKVSMGALRNEPTTTNAQLLRLKRSLPAMRHNQPPVKAAVSRFDRPPSRTDSRIESQRSQPGFRPKTPVDQVRPVNETRATQVRKGQAPFLPAGASQSQSHHVSTKHPRVFRRHDSDQGPEVRPLSRALSRAGMRSPSPRRLGHEKSSSEPMWQQINKPRRLRHFGDGHELDAFDDLPTSAHTESRYTKQPVAIGSKNSIRNKLYQNILPDRTPSPAPPQPQPKTDYLPRFARDTAASRIAREVSLAQRSPLSGPLGPVNAQRMNPLPRSNLNPHLHNQIRNKKVRKPKQLKPHLISNLNSGKESKVVNGMTYNPATYRWEGNENALKAFSTSTSSPSRPPFRVRERETSTPKPLLIANINASKGAKRVGDMVFDPLNMCWLKVDTSTPSTLRSDDPMEGFNILEDEDDPFKDIPDLEDRDKDSAEGGHGRASDIREDWLVGEEFDVGPEFIRRQHEEEARWRRKCEKWTKPGGRSQENWRWALRDMIMGG